MIYAVNNTTKEHRVISGDAREVDDWRNKMQGWHVVEADADGWIEWHGGECPLPPSQLYEATLRSGSHSGRPKRTAGEWVWDHILSSSDIIAYRPILDDKPQSPEWDGEGLPPVGTVCEYRSGYVEKPYEYSQCTIIAHFTGESGSELAAFTYEHHGGVIQVARGADSLFRPIRTDRERWLETACSKLGCASGSLAADWLADLYDAGLAKLPAP